MIYPSILDRQYEQYLPLVKKVAKQVKETMLNFCDNKGYALTSRIKAIESLAEKIETGRLDLLQKKYVLSLKICSSLGQTLNYWVDWHLFKLAQPAKL